MENGKWYYKLTGAHKPCRCVVCRGAVANGACVFTEHLVSNTYQMTEKTANEPTSNAPAIPQETIEYCLRIIQAPVVTKATLRNYLVRNDLPTSGNKRALCERVMRHYQDTTGAQQQQSAQGGLGTLLLAADIVDEEDLMEIDDD